VLNHHQLRSGATRTGVMDSRWFTPYGTYGARPIIYGTAEVGQSTQVPPPIPYNTWSTIQPTGGIPETTANAEQHQPNTEEEESAVGDFYCSPIPHVVDCLFDVRRLRPAIGTRTAHAGYGCGQKSRKGIGGSQATRMQSLVSTFSTL